MILGAAILGPAATSDPLHPGCDVGEGAVHDATAYDALHPTVAELIPTILGELKDL